MLIVVTVFWWHCAEKFNAVWLNMCESSICCKQEFINHHPIYLYILLIVWVIFFLFPLKIRWCLHKNILNHFILWRIKYTYTNRCFVVLFFYFFWYKGIVLQYLTFCPAITFWRSYEIILSHMHWLFFIWTFHIIYDSASAN